MAGEIVHFEIPARDTARACGFWSELFGWKFQAYAASSIEYHMAQVSETTGSAIYAAEGEARGTRAYFDVDDIEAARARVSELGGQASDVMPVASMGWFAICSDTEGNEFGLWQPDRDAATPE